MGKIRIIITAALLVCFVSVPSIPGQETETAIPLPSELPQGVIVAGYPRPKLDFSALDDAVRALPETDSIEETAARLRSLTESDWEKARAVYIWLTENIAYDTAAFFSGSRAVTDPEGVFTSGRSVCQGYSELFVSLAEGLGLPAVMISGFAKGYGYRNGQGFSRTNHAWNGVFIDGSWHLFDSTWGSGYVDGRKFVRHYDEFWFDTHPALFLKTHLPAEDEWQLVEEPVSKEEYVRTPYIESYIFENLSDLGVDDFRLLKAIDEAPALADFFSFEGYDIEILTAPMAKSLRAGEPVTVSIRAPGVQVGSFIMNGQFNDFQAVDEVLGGTFTPSRGTLKVSLKMNYKNRDSYWTVIKYQVQ